MVRLPLASQARYGFARRTRVRERRASRRQSKCRWHFVPACKRGRDCVAQELLDSTSSIRKHLCRVQRGESSQIRARSREAATDAYRSNGWCGRLMFTWRGRRRRQEMSHCTYSVTLIYCERRCPSLLSVAWARSTHITTRSGGFCREDQVHFARRHSLPARRSAPVFRPDSTESRDEQRANRRRRPTVAGVCQLHAIDGADDGPGVGDDESVPLSPMGTVPRQPVH